MAEIKFMSKEAISLPTPKAATWIFRIVIILTGAATLIIAGDPGIPNELKVRLAVYLKGLDLAVWGIGRLLGIKKEDFEQPE